MSKSKSQSVRDKLGQWDSRLAVLSEGQKESYMSLSSIASTRPMPAAVSVYVRGNTCSREGGKGLLGGGDGGDVV